MAAPVKSVANRTAQFRARLAAAGTSREKTAALCGWLQAVAANLPDQHRAAMWGRLERLAEEFGHECRH